VIKNQPSKNYIHTISGKLWAYVHMHGGFPILDVKPSADDRYGIGQFYIGSEINRSKGDLR